MEGPKKVTVRKVRREPPELSVSLDFARNFERMVRRGDFDAVLDTLWNAVDGRLRTYFQEGENRDAAQEYAAEKIRMMRVAPEKLVHGHYYGVHGEKYEAVRVVYLGKAAESENNGIPKVKVRVVSNPRGTELSVGKMYKVPPAALDMLTESQSELRSFYEGGK